MSVLYVKMENYNNNKIISTRNMMCLLMYHPLKHETNRIWVTQRVFYKKQELDNLHKHLGSFSVFGGVRVGHLFSFLCCVGILCFVCLRPVLCYQCCQRLWNIHFWLAVRLSLTLVYPSNIRGHRGHDCMEIGFTTTYAISAYNH